MVKRNGTSSEKSIYHLDMSVWPQFEMTFKKKYKLAEFHVKPDKNLWWLFDCKSESQMHDMSEPHFIHLYSANT